GEDAEKAGRIAHGRREVGRRGTAAARSSGSPAVAARFTNAAARASPDQAVANAPMAATSPRDTGGSLGFPRSVRPPSPRRSSTSSAAAARLLPNTRLASPP